jgi:iron complex outermembrane receptor protein
MNIELRRLWILLGATTAIVPFYSGVAVGQAAEGIEEVTVTARRREENLQDVPIAITALGAEDFQRKGIADLERVSDFTAGLDFEDLSTTFNGVLTIRGLTQADVQNRVQNVAVFLDGVFIPRNYSIDMGIADFERIEVVKGPQSALYGQNAFAGALNYVTNKASNEFEASVSATVGSDGRVDYKGSVGGPIIQDKLAARVFVGHTEFDGNRPNSFPTVGSELAETGGYDRDAWGLSVAITPTDRLDIDFLYYETDRHEEIRPGYTVSGNTPGVSHNCGPPVAATGNPSFYCGELPDSADPFQTPLSTRPSGDQFPNQPGSDTNSKITRASINY